MKVIGIIGQAGHGKDTAGAWFIAKGWQRIGFADMLYQEVAQAFNTTPEWLGRREFKELPTEELSLVKCNDPNFAKVVMNITGKAATDALSPREVLQMWGTEYRRNFGNNQNYWLDKVAESLQPTKNYVVTDVRFINEAQAVKDWGGDILRVVRPTYAIQSSAHPSETSLAKWVPDFELSNDSTIESLYSKMEQMF